MIHVSPSFDEEATRDAVSVLGSSVQCGIAQGGRRAMHLLRIHVLDQYQNAGDTSSRVLGAHRPAVRVASIESEDLSDSVHISLGGGEVERAGNAPRVHAGSTV